MKNMRTFWLLALSIIFLACANPKKEALEEKTDTAVESVTEATKVEEDTTICEHDCSTAHLDDAIEYFRANNKFKDWPASDKKQVVVRGIAEKDSTLSRISIKSCGNKELDDEAIRLIKEARLSPAQNGQGEHVRSRYTNVVHFPPK